MNALDFTQLAATSFITEWIILFFYNLTNVHYKIAGLNCLKYLFNDN